jgi:YVTN family beta-propeller protein
MEGKRGVALALVCLVAALSAGCGGRIVERDRSDALPIARAVGVDDTPDPNAPLPARSYSKLRVFVAAEGKYFGGTGEIYVLEAGKGEDFKVVARLPQGGWPHNVSLSPDGRYVAVANRSSDQVSIIDPYELAEVARFPVGRVPHGISWSPDSRWIFTAHERDPFIGKIAVGTWKMTPLMVGTPQHVTVMDPRKPNELWYTVTNSSQPDHLRLYDLEGGTITRVAVEDVHDVYFTPDFSELWSSSSGFLERPSDRMVVYDPVTRKVKETIRLAGRYPFHGMKANRDGAFYLPDGSIMLISSHWSSERGKEGASLLWVDWKARKIVGDTPLGRHVFHMTYDPLGHRVLATSNVDGMVNVIDVVTRKVTHKVAVPKAHGIVAIGIP